MDNFLEVFALKVEQPLSTFFIATIKAKDLLEISFSEELQYVDERGMVVGNQRKIDEKRLKEIGRYIDSVEMSFPNSIILGANYSEEGVIIEDESDRWDFYQIEKNLYKIIIPSKRKLAVIIDGQHRLRGFGDNYLLNKDRLYVDLPCSIFFDLPNSYQAFLFATINGNQRKVDKSLALEQFGFNVEDEPQDSWTPEKLAVFFTRKLNFKESPLKGHIRLAPKISSELYKEIFIEQSEWMVSTATIVDGILNLISSNPKRDRVEMAQENIWGKRSRKMIAKFSSDKSPLRQKYLNKEDDYIFDTIKNYLTVAKETIWKDYNPKSYIFKTVGVQAVFDLLRRILEKNNSHSLDDFKPFFSKTNIYDFSNPTLQASGIGRKDIRNALLLASGVISKEILKDEDFEKVEGLKTIK